jgi:predicted AAA+ superfamily ATPase
MERASQWDIRINVPTDNDLNACITNIQRRYERDNIVYVHVSGVEKSTTSEQRHVHIALILQNRTSKNSVIRKFINNPGHGYYVAARDMTMDLYAWIEYHAKKETKVNPDGPGLILELGRLPRKRVNMTEEQREEKIKKQKSAKAEQWERRRVLVKAQDWETLDEEFPGFIWSTSGQNMKRELLKQANDEFNEPLQGPLNNFIIWGPSGSGKSSSISLLYPQCYKKQKGTQFWDAYDRTDPNHSVVWIDEFSKETLKTLCGKPDGGFEFLKELGDRYPVTIDEKYTKGYKIRPKMIVITMNEHPDSLLPKRATEVNRQALYRKFRILHVSEWLKMNGLKNTNEGVVYLN